MLKVLVTGTSGTNVGTQVLMSLLMLPQRYEVVATDMAWPFFGYYKTSTAYQVPPASSADYIPRIMEICHKEKIEAIVPGSEAELAVCSTMRKSFHADGVATLINNAKVIETCQDKMATNLFLEQADFPFARYLLLDLDADPEVEADRVLGKLVPPLVAKPYVNSGGSQGLVLIQNRHDLVAMLKLARSRPGRHLMIQEYEGDAEQEYTVGVMSGPDGRAFSAFVLKRLINTTLTRLIHAPNADKSRIKSDYLTISTGISQGWTGEFPVVREFAMQLADALGSTGPLNIQCRLTERGVVVFEINPRFSGTTSIRSLCGHNDPDLIVRSHLLGEHPGQAEYKCGLVLRYLDNFLIEGISPPAA